MEYNPYSREAQHNPYPIWRKLRDEAPVYFNPEFNFYALTRYDDVMNALLDPATFISSEGNLIDGADKGQGFLIGMDPPEHSWYRKIMSRVFTTRRVAGLEPFVRRIASGYLDRVRDDSAFDMVTDFSLRLPLDVIGELLGIPPEDRPTVHQLSIRTVARADTPTPGGLPPADALAAAMELRALLQGLVVERRRRPRDDVISMLIESEVTDDDGKRWRMSDDVIAAQFHLLAFAGHETVTKLIGNGAVALWWYPDQRRQLVADPKLIPGAVEEILRWDNAAPFAGRWSSREVSLHGTTIPADSRVMLIIGSANHDERQYEEPELFDIHRRSERPLVLGFGVHLCLGAALARLETRVAFEEFLLRFPDFEIDVDGIVRGSASMFRGLEHLPIVPSPSASR